MLSLHFGSWVGPRFRGREQEGREVRGREQEGREAEEAGGIAGHGTSRVQRRVGGRQRSSGGGGYRAP